MSSTAAFERDLKLTLFLATGFRLGTRWKSFWHTMTSYDRHASHDSPYRTGQHVPLTSGRHAPLTSIATSGIESRPDLTYIDDDSLKSPTYLRDGDLSSPASINSPLSPYLPGMRSSSAKSLDSQLNGDRTESRPGEIQLQNFHQGLPPPPPVKHSWRRIDRWAEDDYKELYDQLSEGATLNDLNELEHMLDCSLPMEVRDSIQIHDGQERGGMPTGIIFGCMLLDCEEIVQEWQQWRTVNREFLADKSGTFIPAKPVASGSSSLQNQQTANPNWRQELLAKQDSQPSNAVVKAYAHPGWIPLARDWGGNNIAVDLAPAPAGTWGQVIIFGRDFDCKYVVARSWSAFLAMVADDLAGQKWFVDEETGELKLREFKSNAVEPGYLDILRWRMDQKYGRKVPRRRPMRPMTVSLNTSGHGKSISPHGSPDGTEFERGRSMHRFAGGHQAMPSPKIRPAKSSPLAKVAEEAPAPITVHTAEKGKDGGKAVYKRNSKLIDAPTPTTGYDDDSERKDSSDATNVEPVKDGALGKRNSKGLEVDGADRTQTPTEDTLKNVDL
ncbi:MAG: Cell wall assembly regulator [Peltula sp. TS41687]|nr:MAG: Cell wall assembly regulator [Peltula sp. TS41687]